MTESYQTKHQQEHSFNTGLDSNRCQVGFGNNFEELATIPWLLIDHFSRFKRQGQQTAKHAMYKYLLQLESELDNAVCALSHLLLLHYCGGKSRCLNPLTSQSNVQIQQTKNQMNQNEIQKGNLCGYGCKGNI